MGKKQRERKAKREAARRHGSEPVLPLIAEPSPVARTIIEKLTALSYLTEERVARVLFDSADFRTEPEFEDLYFPIEATTRALDRVTPRYASKFERAATQSEEARRELSEQMTIEMVEIAATHEFRRDALRRFDRMVNRLITTDDAEKIETALVLAPMLREKALPWGAVGLFFEIFQDTQDAVTAPFEDAQEILTQIAAAMGKPESTEELFAQLNDPVTGPALMEQFAQDERVNALLQESMDKTLDQFEDQIDTGAIEIELFTPDEVGQVLTALLMARKDLETRIPNPSNETVQENANPIFDAELNRIMTPERTTQAQAQLRTICDDWYRHQNIYAAALDIEISELTEIPPSENTFLQAIIRRAVRKLLYDLSAAAEGLDLGADESQDS